MKRHLEVLLLLIILLIGSLGITFGLANELNRETHSNWQRGLPTKMNKQAVWLSDLKVLSRHSSGSYYCRNYTVLGHNTNFNLESIFYNNAYKKVGNNGDNGSMLYVKPYYRKVGFHKYEVISGGKNLKQDRSVINNSSLISKYLIKKDGFNRIKIWHLGNHGQLGHFYGAFNRINRNPATEIERLQSSNYKKGSVFDEK